LLGVTGPTRSPISRARALRLNVVFAVSFLSAATLVTLGVFGMRQLLPDHIDVPPVLVGLLFVFLAACDLRLGPLRTPGLMRQTCPAWRHRFGIPLATAFWGLDIGTTLSTIKVTSLYWAAVIALIAVAPPRPELAVACFAAGYLLSHLAGVWRVARGVNLTAALSWANGQVTRTRTASGVALGSIGALIFTQAVVGWHW
jgi:hypothetical protein